MAATVLFIFEVLSMTKNEGHIDLRLDCMLQFVCASQCISVLGSLEELEQEVVGSIPC